MSSSSSGSSSSVEESMVDGGPTTKTSVDGHQHQDDGGGDDQPTASASLSSSSSTISTAGLITVVPSSSEEPRGSDQGSGSIEEGELPQIDLEEVSKSPMVLELIDMVTLDSEEMPDLSEHLPKSITREELLDEKNEKALFFWGSALARFAKTYAKNYLFQDEDAPELEINNQKFIEAYGLFMLAHHQFR